MPTYAELQADPAYRTNWAGASLRVTFVNESDPTKKFVGLTTSYNPNDNFEQMPVEESGNEMSSETVTGRYDGALSCSVMWTPEKADQAPTAINFISQGYWTVLVSSAGKRPKETVILEVIRGFKFSNRSDPFSGRGQRTMNLSGIYLQRLSGAEWAAEAGT